MKQRIILLAAILALILTGCSSKGDTEEISLTEEGKVLLEKNEYSEAMNKLQEALKEDESDDHARAMYMQAMRMIDVEYYKNIKNYDKAVEELEIIEEIKGGSSLIEDLVKDEKDEIITLKEEQEKDEAQRKENARTVAKKDKYLAQKKAEEDLLKQLEEQRKKEEEEAKKKEEEEQKKEEEQQEEAKPEGETPPPTEEVPQDNAV